MPRAQASAARFGANYKLSSGPSGPTRNESVHRRRRRTGSRRSRRRRPSWNCWRLATRIAELASSSSPRRRGRGRAPRGRRWGLIKIVECLPCSPRARSAGRAFRRLPSIPATSGARAAEHAPSDVRPALERRHGPYRRAWRRCQKSVIHSQRRRAVRARVGVLENVPGSTGGGRLSDGCDDSGLNGLFQSEEKLPETETRAMPRPSSRHMKYTRRL